MRLRRERTAPRTGFTIIELLVVILIIILLMGLLLPAVQRVMITLEDAKVSAEVSQLAQGLEAFRTKHGDYPPSRIRLYEAGAVAYPSYGLTTPAGLLETYSVDTLRRLFPGIYLALDDPALGGAPALYDTPGVEWHDWNGNRVRDFDPTRPYVDLEGEECLVFFLGGIPAFDLATSPPVINCTGFCTDMVRPTIPTPGRNRNGPYFEFKSERLVQSGLQNPNLYVVYRDHYQTPYAYFRARYGTENNYPCSLLPAPGNISDCEALMVSNNSAGFIPYCIQERMVGTTRYVRFHQPDKFQIISAGRDRVFGAGRFYNPADPDQLGTRWDKDNLTSFGTGKLGG